MSGKDSFIFRKLQRNSLNQKNVKVYCQQIRLSKFVLTFKPINILSMRSNSLLLIEITQTVHFANLGNHQPNKNFNDVLKIISNESKFGIVLCYVEYTVPGGNTLHFKGTVYPAYGKDCTKNAKTLFQKITKGEFNTFDGTQSISKH